MEIASLHSSLGDRARLHQKKKRKKKKIKQFFWSVAQFIMGNALNLPSRGLPDL